MVIPAAEHGVCHQARTHRQWCGALLHIFASARRHASTLTQNATDVTTDLRSAPPQPQPAQHALGPASDSSTASAAEGESDDASGRNADGAPRDSVDRAKCRRGRTANRRDRRASKPAT
jgi:hypothetical protein